MFRISKSLLFTSLLVGFALQASAQTIDPSLYAGLQWRNVGPFRGGRVSAVTGAIGQPGVFYMGLPLGGVWKTTSAGQTWYPVFDSVKEVSCIGAIAVAPSDPNTIYAGTGDMITGGGINEGNGVYKSTDAGKTWQHMGLDDSKQIPAVLVDPKDPNLVLVACQGNIHAHTKMRGVFRSTDGGQTWKNTLFVDNETGGQDLGWAYDHPNVILCTTVRHYNAPGAGGRGFGGFGAQDGPTGTSLYKSTDEGLTWTDISENDGLPRLVGRCTVAVANSTNAQRMFLVGTFGLYRSDDGGTTWRQMDASDRRIGNGQGNYTSGVFVDPQNPDIVYTLATCSYRSLDGGKTFTGFKGAPGGDDPQRMWIDPTDGKRIFLGGDQGGVVSLDGGENWGSWYNQPTGQVYHISTDNQYPYWVYATQQDSGSIATCVRGNLGEVTPLDWLPHPGYEFGYIVADPLNPKISYAGGPDAGIIKVTYPSGQWINVSPNVDTSEPLRKVGNQPMAFSPKNPHELLVGFQYLMSTTDGGLHWRKISPDLAVPKGEPAPPATKPLPTPAPKPTPAKPAGISPAGAPPAAPAPGAPQRRAFGGGAIDSFSVSSIGDGIIWVGTNNGFVKLTKDHGRNWEDVSIPDMPRADIVCIDSSHTDPAAAYAAIDMHNTGDYAPHFYRTHDYGKTWTKIVTDLPTDQPSGSFSRVIRADTRKAGLLFAGTESSMYVSFDDGDHWQSLMQNLPNTSYRDIAIHDNDLVVGTYGRGFWVLDDYSPLRELTPAIASESAHLFKPGDAIRVRRNVNGDTPFPPEVPHAANPPLGAIIYYSLSQKPQSDITLEILDSSGTVVRHMSSAPIPPYTDAPSAVPDWWWAQRNPLPTEAGTNRVNWNIRYDDPPAFNHNIGSIMGAVPHDTPAEPEGPLALPGLYTVRLTVDGKSYEQPLTVKNDPRSPANYAELRAQHDLQMKLDKGIQEAYNGYQQVAAMRARVAEIVKSKPNADVSTACKDFDAKLVAIGGAPFGGRRFGGGGFGRGGGGAAPQPTFMMVNGTLIRELNTLDFADMTPSQPMLHAWVAGGNELKTVVLNWNSFNSKELVAFNAVLAKNNIAVLADASPLAVPDVPMLKKGAVAVLPGPFGNGEDKDDNGDADGDDGDGS